jgi:D-ornithine 4,5-aminomutase subunit alpha
MKERLDDFKTRRQHLKNMSDAELKAYFLELADKIVDPLLDLSFKNTSKSIERSVLLRMGFSSIEAKGIVEILSENNLLRKGTGHCVYVVAKNKGIDIHDAGLLIQNGDEIDYLMEYFNVYENN